MPFVSRSAKALPKRPLARESMRELTALLAAAALLALAACSFLAAPPLAPYVAATATATIYLGSVSSLKQRSARARDARRPPEAIHISASKAWWLPICGSMMALGVASVLIKLLGNKLANYLQLLYFGLCLVGVADTFEAVASLLLPNAAESRELVVRLSPICEDLRLNALQLTCWFSAVVPMVAYYAFTKHWLLNNLIMVSLCQSVIAGLSFISTTRNVVFSWGWSSCIMGLFYVRCRRGRQRHRPCPTTYF